MIKAKQSVRLVVTLAALLFYSTVGHSQNCAEITRNGVFNTTVISRNTQSQKAFKDFQCSSDFQSHDDAMNAGVSIGVPIYGVPLQIGGTFSENQKNVWKRENCSESQLSASFQESYQVLMQHASPEILTTWLGCVISKSIGLQCTAQNLDAETVVFRAIWNPSEGDTGNAPNVESSFISGGTRANTNSHSLFEAGTVIRRGQGNRVLIKRSGRKRVVVVLNTSRGDCDAEVAAPTPPPTPPPSPVYETRWFKEDESGRQYSQTFSHVSENRHNRGGVNKSGQYNISDPSGRIYRVDFRHEGEFCGWNYNPDGGYGGNTTIIDGGRGFIWRRRWDGKPCTEFYTAYYEVQRRVCVANCR